MYLIDNIFQDRYNQFLRVVQEWCHLRMLQCSGRGHDSGGAEVTSEGECAVLCPACPQPGKNLPTGWMEVPLEKQ